MLKLKSQIAFFYKNNFYVIFMLLLFGCASQTKNSNVAVSDSPEASRHDVWLTVGGAGKTSQIAKEQALRDAIMQTYGAFVSTRTEVINDKLLSDGITTVTQGIIKSCSTVSDNLMMDGSHNCVFRVNLSIGGLISTFKNSSTDSIEFNGSDFVFNIKQQQLNESNELRAISDIIPVVTKISQDCFDYKIKAGPVKNIGGDVFEVALEVIVTANSNSDILIKYVSDVIRSLELTGAEIKNYKSIGKQVYPVFFSYWEMSMGHNLRTSQAQSLYNDIASLICGKNSDFAIVEKSTGKKVQIFSSKLDASFSHSLSSAKGDYITTVKGGSSIGKYLIKIHVQLKDMIDITGYTVIKT